MTTRLRVVIIRSLTGEGAPTPADRPSSFPRPPRRETNRAATGG